MKVQMLRFKTAAVITAAAVTAGVFMCGCDGLRFAPGQVQKQNAWLHNRTARLTADKAQQEDTSAKLRALARLSADQSRAFCSYFGLPDQMDADNTADEILAGAGADIAQKAYAQAAQRPDVWQTADGLMEAAAAVAGLFGGVYAAAAVKYLKQARQKAKALKEIIDGNESLRQMSGQIKDAFGKAHQNQSASTKSIVAKLKAR
jgi:hypothetical protein